MHLQQLELEGPLCYHIKRGIKLRCKCASYRSGNLSIVPIHLHYLSASCQQPHCLCLMYSTLWILASPCCKYYDTAEGRIHLDNYSISPCVCSQHHRAWPEPGAGGMVTCSSHGPVTRADGTGSGVAIRHRAMGKGYGVQDRCQCVCSLYVEMSR